MSQSMTVYGTTLGDQRLVFAHLLDLTQGSMAFDDIQVLTGDPRARLAHHFGQAEAERIEDIAGTFPTLVLIPGSADLNSPKLIKLTEGQGLVWRKPC